MLLFCEQVTSASFSFLFIFPKTPGIKITHIRPSLVELEYPSLSALIYKCCINIYIKISTHKCVLFVF